MIEKQYNYNFITLLEWEVSKDVMVYSCFRVKYEHHDKDVMVNVIWVKYHFSSNENHFSSVYELLSW